MQLLGLGLLGWTCELDFTWTLMAAMHFAARPIAVAIRRQTIRLTISYNRHHDVKRQHRYDNVTSPCNCGWPKKEILVTLEEGYPKNDRALRWMETEEHGEVKFFSTISQPILLVERKLFVASFTRAALTSM